MAKEVSDPRVSTRESLSLVALSLSTTITEAFISLHCLLTVLLVSAVTI